MWRILVVSLIACAAESGDRQEVSETAAGTQYADVVSVEAVPVDRGYRFAVGLSSPDTGCEQYADWWEVISEDGELIYRRPLAHSHVEEQPFVRSGGPVEIAADTEVWARGHMHPGGYGGVAFFGSVEDGFAARRPPAGFAAELVDVPPAPPECRW